MVDLVFPASSTDGAILSNEARQLEPERRRHFAIGLTSSSKNNQTIKMKFANNLAHFTTLPLVALFSLVAATPIVLIPLDIYTPPVLDPHTGTVWTVGNQYNVTWDTSNPPAQITNRFGSSIVLRKGPLITNHTLASEFDILLGTIGITAPDVVPGDDYAVVLFGDSGNISPAFTIAD
ncbi:hypothetical protein EW146_g2817 [Bondarzewia mesenterica]|uniref:Uncharacterized protein n=1 Tax=Bondarzewia mesenterica TaxID=1095465 RepID=A0A4S4M5Q0_9AGAM|nr:hypothetical protein EW146_g2817 [Bondarzewia mesenterica]